MMGVCLVQGCRLDFPFRHLRLQNLSALGLLLIFGLIAGVPPYLLTQAADVLAATGIVLELVIAGNGLGYLLGPPAVAGVIEAISSWRQGTAVPVIACGCGVVCAWVLSRLKALPVDS